MQRTALTLGVALVLSVHSPAYAEPDESPSVDVGALYDQAARLASRGNVRGAIAGFKEVAAADPELADAYYNVGSLSEHSSSWLDCSLYFRRFLDLRPDDGDAASIRRSIGRCDSQMPSPGTLVVSVANADRALIAVDGVAIGRGAAGPLTLPAGTYALTAISADFEPSTEQVVIAAGETTTHAVTLTEITYYGSVTIQVEQPGATVSVDGVVRGTSPLEGPLRLATGRYRVEITLNDYHPWRRNIDILRDLDDLLEVRLIHSSIDLSTMTR